MNNRARRAEQTRAWKARHPEVSAARDKKWYEANKDKKAERERIRRSTEAGKALTRQRYQDNKEEAARKNRCYYLKNREYLLARSRQRYKDNPEPVTAGKRRYRARKFNADHEPYSTADINGVWHEQGGVCVYCQAPLFAYYHVDHVTPLSRGGADKLDNLALACPTCNSRKKAKTGEEFREVLKSDKSCQRGAGAP